MKEAWTNGRANHPRLRRGIVDPFTDSLWYRVELAGCGGFAQSAIHHGADHGLSTFRRQASILVRVHSVLRESLGFGDISVPGQDRMDNLLKVHT